MITLKKSALSQVGRKAITALTGLLLVGFVITHLLGNLALLDSSGEMLNLYTAKLASLGPLKIIAEVILFVLFSSHIVNGILLKRQNAAARGSVGYKNWKSKSGKSRAGMSSLNMALSGVVLTIFLILHIKQFALGPGISEGYTTTINGQEYWDLYRVVVEAFSNPLNVAFYVAAMISLGLHLKHGVWSAFQSMGWLNSRFSPVISIASVIVAAVLSFGFIVLPVIVYFRS